MAEQSAFQINTKDCVATALTDITEGTEVEIYGDRSADSIKAVTDVPKGHKIALMDIKKGEHIIKYDVVIGRATQDIKKGSWIHLHNMESIYDTRSSHLDAVTGAPKDTKYE